MKQRHILRLLDDHRIADAGGGNSQRLVDLLGERVFQDEIDAGAKESEDGDENE